MAITIASPELASRAEMNYRIGKGRSRTVTEADAKLMKSTPGVWYVADHRGADKWLQTLATQTRKRLAKYYGGEWRARARDGKLLVCFVSEVQALSEAA